MFGTQGSKTFTASGIVGVSGKPVRVMNAVTLSKATVGKIVLRNGTTTSGTIIVAEDGASGQSKNYNWEGGLLFTDGCYLSFDYNLTSATISYRTEA